VDAIDLSPLAGRTLLVISDLGTPMDPEVSKQLTMLLKAAQAAHATILGDGPILLDAHQGDEDKVNVNLVARVQKARNGRPVDASDFFPTMRQWLADNDDADMLLWLSPPGPDAKGIAYTVIAPQTMVHGKPEHDIAVTIARTLRTTADDL